MLGSLGGCLRLSDDGDGTTGVGRTTTTRGPTDRATAPPADTTTDPGTPPDTETATDTETETTEGDAEPPDSIDGAWRQFQGDAANTGVAGGAAPQDPVEVLWEQSFSGEFGHNGLVVADGRVFVPLHKPDGGAFLCVDATTGAEQWRLATAPSLEATPAVVDGTVYVGDRNSVVTAIDAAAGTRLARYEFGDHADRGVSAGITHVDGALYAGTDAGSVARLDADLNEVWRFEADRSVGRSTPAVAGDTVYVGSISGTVHALDAADGTERWSSTVGDAVFAAPTVVDGTVYVGGIVTTDGEGPIEKADGDEIAQNRETTGVLAALDAATGDQAWRADLDRLVVTSPALADGTVFVPQWDGPLYAHDAASGDREWFAPIENVQEGAPVVVDDTVLAVGATVRAFTAADGRTRWRYRSDNGVDVTPAVADGVVFVGDHDGVLTALYGSTGG
jgi:outer membrane protein assembly factor BamB